MWRICMVRRTIVDTSIPVTKTTPSVQTILSGGIFEYLGDVLEASRNVLEPSSQLSWFYSFQNPTLEPSRELWMGRGLLHSSHIFIRSRILRWSHLGNCGWDGPCYTALIFYSFQNPPLEPSRELWMGRGLPHSSPVFIRSSILRWSHLGYFGWDGVKIISLYGPSTKADVRTEKGIE
jgi:hypothetical protein